MNADGLPTKPTLITSPFATHVLVATGAGLPLAIGLAAAQWSLALVALVRVWVGRGLGRGAGLAVAAGRAHAQPCGDGGWAASALPMGRPDNDPAAAPD